jgi:hypothetical protein
METVADHLLPFMSGWRGTGESPPRSTDNGERLERGGGKRRVIGEEWRRDKGDWGMRRSEGASGSPEEDAGTEGGAFPLSYCCIDPLVRPGIRVKSEWTTMN